MGLGLGWMVGEEGVGGRHAVRAAPGSHIHPPLQRRGLGTGEAGGARSRVCSLSTQVLHGGRPGRTEAVLAAAALKYLLEP